MPKADSDWEQVLLHRVVFGGASGGLDRGGPVGREAGPNEVAVPGRSSQCAKEHSMAVGFIQIKQRKEPNATC
ncbi:hypothetical protein GCM10022409_40110 [Hymenobacter glaciei]|uniref:Uncharacterized protein n=1 Tax=Hymenobacter glaciei TaxID=877209 RepID=A0ABP7UPZ4_9BACT